MPVKKVIKVTNRSHSAIAFKPSFKENTVLRIDPGQTITIDYTDELYNRIIQAIQFIGLNIEVQVETVEIPAPKKVKAPVKPQESKKQVNAEKQKITQENEQNKKE